MDKIYDETVNQVAFDWNKFLEEATQRHPNSDEHDRVTYLAESWMTCACGNQCAIIPRSAKNGSPNDAELCELGYQFYKSIQRGDWVEAKQYLKDIEARAIEVMQETLTALNA